MCRQRRKKIHFLHVIKQKKKLITHPDREAEFSI